jgi:hypothetical protein
MGLPAVTPDNEWAAELLTVGYELMTIGHLTGRDASLEAPRLLYNCIQKLIKVVYASGNITNK